MTLEIAEVLSYCFTTTPVGKPLTVKVDFFAPFCCLQDFIVVIDIVTPIFSRAPPLVRFHISVKIVLPELDKLLKVRLRIKYILESES